MSDEKKKGEPEVSPAELVARLAGDVTRLAAEARGELPHPQPLSPGERGGADRISFPLSPSGRGCPDRIGTGEGIGGSGATTP
jgi:hypothetical protein